MINSEGSFKPSRVATIPIEPDNKPLETYEDRFFKINYVIFGVGFVSWVRDIPVEHEVCKFLRVTRMKNNSAYNLDRRALDLVKYGVVQFSREYRDIPF